MWSPSMAVNTEHIGTLAALSIAQALCGAATGQSPCLSALDTLLSEVHSLTRTPTTPDTTGRTRAVAALQAALDALPRCDTTAELFLVTGHTLSQGGGGSTTWVIS